MSSNSYCTKLNNRLSAVRATVALGLAALILFAQAASAETWRDQLPQAKEVGQGELRWFGFRIYSAKLWSQTQPFNQNDAFALELTYHRAISREQFVEKSIDEIKRIFGSRYSDQKLHAWSLELGRVFPSVVEGDELIGVYLPQRGCRFYGKNTALGEIADVELAQAFFAIWLDPKTKDSTLRANLLGLGK